jgi:hypothetical protein
MTDATPRATSSGGPFAPQSLVPINVGQAIVNLYPIIDQSMATHKQAHAFHINRRISTSAFSSMPDHPLEWDEKIIRSEANFIRQFESAFRWKTR